MADQRLGFRRRLVLRLLVERLADLASNSTLNEKQAGAFHRTLHTVLSITAKVKVVEDPKFLTHLKAWIGVAHREPQLELSRDLLSEFIGKLGAELFAERDLRDLLICQLMHPSGLRANAIVNDCRRYLVTTPEPQLDIW